MRFVGDKNVKTLDAVESGESSFGKYMRDEPWLV
jgi:hypothetical protein